MNKLKSIGAILAGFLVVFVLSTLTDFALEALGVLPPATEGLFVTWMLVLALAYRIVYTVLGGYVTARLAPRNPQYHVHVLGIVGTIAGCVGIYVGWNMSDHWYPIALAVTAYACCWYGGQLAKSK
jgi:hypothetical protein